MTINRIKHYHCEELISKTVMTSLVVIIEVKLENHLKNDKKSLVPHDQNSTF